MSDRSSSKWDDRTWWKTSFDRAGPLWTCRTWGFCRKRQSFLLANQSEVSNDRGWTEEALVYFENITYCAQWKPLRAKICSVPSAQNSDCFQVLLFDPSTYPNLDIRQKLLTCGFAVERHDSPIQEDRDGSCIQQLLRPVTAFLFLLYVPSLVPASLFQLPVPAFLFRSSSASLRSRVSQLPLFHFLFSFLFLLPLCRLPVQLSLCSSSSLVPSFAFPAFLVLSFPVPFLLSLFPLHPCSSFPGSSFLVPAFLFSFRVQARQPLAPHAPYTERS
ncbi:hypothetical protein GDO86_016690 [Hymenochirus boettgeri]|uniref:Uncharacterized protein n=1 Tax=Hymenochirus boettgeri TaxID=247094 RepID=A0A8T2IMQ5_9PIPI|nr:hypothetical protein GDO86_016690 [Hymenochirus boettgeri]